MVCRNGKILKQYTTDNCGFIPHNLVSMVYEDQNENWWIASYKGLGVKYKDGREICFNSLEGVDKVLSTEITSIIEDCDNSLWLATCSNGIIHVTGEMEKPHELKCKVYSLNNGLLPVNTPLCIHKDKSGRIWVGTEGSGLCVYNLEQDNFDCIHKLYTIPGDMVSSIQEDNNGNLWLGTNQGLIKLAIYGECKGDVKVFTVADGLIDNFFNQNASFSRGDDFYFGSSKGIVVFNTNDITYKKSKVILNITDI